MEPDDPFISPPGFLGTLRAALDLLGFSRARVTRSHLARSKSGSEVGVEVEGFEAHVTQYGAWPSLEMIQEFRSRGIEVETPERFMVLIVPLDSAAGRSRSLKSWRIAGAAGSLYCCAPGEGHEISFRLGVWRTTKETLDLRARVKAARKAKAERKIKEYYEGREAGRVFDQDGVPRHAGYGKRRRKNGNYDYD